MLPKISAYKRDSDETKYMSFSTKNEELLVNIQENIWDKVINIIKKRSDSEPVYDEKISRNLNKIL